MKNNKGFTLVEIVIAIVLMGTLIALTLGKFNFTTRISDNIATELMSSFNTMEASWGNYVNDKNTTPTNFGDTTFVPLYLMVPPAPTGFDTSYGTQGYALLERTGQASPNNGWYISTRVAVTNSSDPKWQAITAVASKLPTTKFYYNTAGAAVTNMAAPAGATTVYATYWLTRY